jgi:hypothetical protein
MLDNATRDNVEMGSERGFGLTFAIVLIVIGLWPLVKGGAPRWWAIIVACIFLTVVLLWPATLRPLNVLWFRFGLLLGTVVTPIVMGLLYVMTFLPIAVLLRVTGKDLLGLKKMQDRPTYWVVRDASGAHKGTMKQQF